MREKERDKYKKVSVRIIDRDDRDRRNFSMEISYDIRVKLISNVRFIISFGVEWIKELSLYLED